MAAWNEILRRAHYLGRRSQFDRELADEIQFHIEARAEDLVEQGVTAKAARERARREFGSPVRLAEEARSAWQIAWLEDLWRDLGYGARMLTKSAGFSAIAVLSLAMGVGANCAMFVFVDALLLRPLAVLRPGEVLTVNETNLTGGTSGVSYPDYLDLRDRNKSFDGVAGFMGVSIGFAGRPGVPGHKKDGQLVTGNYFDVLGVMPALGREFRPQEDQVPGRDAVIVLSHSLWEREFNSDPAVLGKHVWLGGIAFTVVGVTPARFIAFDESLTEDYPDYFVPMMMAPRIGENQDVLGQRDIRSLTTVGRLRPEVPIQQAQAELTTIAASLEKQYPKTDGKLGMIVQTVVRFRTSGMGGAMGIMVMTLSGMVLLAACVNVAGLLTSRAAARAPEIAVRLAVGAGRPRLIRQLLTESLLLAVAGGVAGVGIGYIPVLIVERIMIQVMPESPLTPIRLDERVLLFSAAVALLSVMLFGLMPALQSTRADVASAMKGSGAVGPRRRGLLGNRLWGRHLLVVVQVAISILLVTVSSVVYVWVGKARAVVEDAGFPTAHVLTMSFDPVLKHYKDALARDFYRQLLERAQSTAGARAITLASPALAIGTRPEGRQSQPGPNAGTDALTVWADDSFFHALEIPILRGRGFRSTDSGGAADVAVINEALAKLYWPGQDPIGKRIRVDDGKARWVEVVGVAAIRNYDEVLTIPPPKLIFLPVAQNPKYPPMTLFARSAGDPAALSGPLRAMVRALDANQAIPEIHFWGENAEVVSRGLRMAAQAIGAMGATGLLLALVGLYGLVAYDVGKRTREIGIRMALGASRFALLRVTMWQGSVLAICGIGAGILLNREMADFFIGLLPTASVNNNPNDGVTFTFGDYELAVLALAVLLLTMLAAYIPARRATSVDPSVALRCE